MSAKQSSCLVRARERVYEDGRISVWAPFCRQRWAGFRMQRGDADDSPGKYCQLLKKTESKRQSGGI